ncbi:aminoacyl-tRNA hydrolase [Bacillus sp. SG-1]|uniref:aminoacyl-tRNA hydrolase n=1 Tax=Bacillus sp. SG-1 TaxID=161544 RepID=UPI0001544BD7|nr:aminoacyl-tRNA hydrolase [Bacillus sp. SG-1]EDL64254.1 peptidyl-tRNA hydrolase [Bacillus sp. SG-1]
MPASEVVQYFIVNKELNMSAGKIAAQTAHAATISTIDLLSDRSSFANFREDFIEWYQAGMTKIVLRGKQKDLEKLAEQGFYSIRDSGRTEIASGSLTVVALPPMPKSQAKEKVGHLSLFK